MTDLALSITSADGRVTRWGAGEADARSIPSGLTFSTSVPGGFKDLSCGLLRDYQLDHPDQALFDSVRVYGPGNKTAWEGRMVQFPAQRGASRTISPGAVGWAAHLRDDPSFREIYVDRDLNRFDGPLSNQRQINIQSTEIHPGTTTVAADDSGTQALVFSLTEVRNQGDTVRVYIGDAWYDAQGIELVSVYYDLTTWDKGAAGQLAGNWVADILAGSDDHHTAFTSSGSLAKPSAGYFTFGTDRRYVNIRTSFPVGAGAVDTTGIWTAYWRKLAAYGRHNLTKRGSDPGGFYASDVVADIVARAAPMLTYSTGAGGSIESTTFVIPHLVFTDPVTAEDAISLVNGYHLYEWGVWENREFFWRQPSPDRLTWQARLADGAKIDLEGDDANNIFNGVYVTYSDPSGRKKTAGPPGSGADTEDSSLVDTSPDNPVNQHGIPRRWARLDISQVTTPAGAVQIGAVYLAEKSLPSRRGTMTLTGTVTHPTKGRRPVWEIRAGDYVQLTDRPDDPVRRILESRYDHDSLTISLSLDNTVYKLDSLLERLGVNLVGTI